MLRSLLLSSLLLGLARSASPKATLPTILVHGGAGDVTGPYVELKNNGTKAAVRRGYQVLQEGGSPLEAVVAAIKVRIFMSGKNIRVGMK